MEWQQIVGFYHVARLGSFTRAARATFRTQPALSQQVKALEKELGCLLIERVGKRKLLLTSQGERFFAFVRKTLEDYDSLLEELNGLKGLPQGRLSIAAPFTTLYHLFPEILKKYTTRFPHIELTILDRPQETVIKLVENADVDFGFVLESQVPKALNAIPWKRVETVLMVPLGHPLSMIKPLALRQIAKYPLILPPRGAKHAHRKKIEEMFQKEGIAYRVIMESSNVELTSLYVEMGLGVSFATVVRDLPVLEQRKLEFLPVKVLFPPDRIVVVTRKHKKFTFHKKAFFDLLIKSA